jgi:hypothetical protein
MTQNLTDGTDAWSITFRYGKRSLKIYSIISGQLQERNEKLEMAAMSTKVDVVDHWNNYSVGRHCGNSLDGLRIHFREMRKSTESESDTNVKSSVVKGLKMIVIFVWILRIRMRGITEKKLETEGIIDSVGFSRDFEIR